MTDDGGYWQPTVITDRMKTEYPSIGRVGELMYSETGDWNPTWTTMVTESKGNMRIEVFDFTEVLELESN